MPHKHAVILLTMIALSVVAGVICGWHFGPEMLSISWIGKLFLNALKMMILPLIVAAVISGIASMGDIRKLEKLGGITILYYLATTGIAVLIGLVMVNIIQPGAGLNISGGEIPARVMGKQET